MIKQDIAERRAGVRAKRILSIQHRIAKSRSKTAPRKWRLSTTQDMSVVGLSFLSDVEYKVGDRLELRVVMSGVLDIFDGLGKIVRVERKKSAAFYVIAVEFLPPKAKPRKAKRHARSAKNRIKKSIKK